MSIFYPLELFSKWLTYTVFSIKEKSLLGNAVEFFVFDVLKIFILLFVLIFVVSFLRSYISKEKIQKTLHFKNKWIGHVLASMLGIVTPFCSCSAIPLFLSLLEAGIPVGITFSFLIASPMINEVAIIMLLSLFGIKVTLIYIFSGFVISIFAGMLLGYFKADKWIMKDILLNSLKEKISGEKCGCKKSYQLKGKIYASVGYSLGIIKKIWIYIILGVGLGAWIHGYVPENFLVNHALASKWYDVPLAVLLGVPLYSNAAGVIPLISSLTEKGLSMGTALAFMMAVTGLSFPEFLILKRIMKWRLIFAFALIVAIGIIFIGYLFNAIL